MDTISLAPQEGRGNRPDGGATPGIPAVHSEYLFKSHDLEQIVESFFQLRSKDLPGFEGVAAGEPVEVPAGPPAKHELWRLPVGAHSPQALTLFSGRALIMDDKLARHLEDVVFDYLKHFPEEPTHARAYGVPLLYGRIDAVFGGGGVRIAEIDDQASFVSLLKYLNPVADSWFVGLEKSLEQSGVPLRLVEQRDPFIGTVNAYHHTDAEWLPVLSSFDNPEEYSVVARSRRWVGGFEAFNNAWESRNILSGRYRDYKGVLAPMGQAVLVNDIDVAADASRIILERLRAEGVPRDELAVMIKGAYSARCEQVWAGAFGDRGRGMDGLEKIRARVHVIERRDQVDKRLAFLLQDYQRPLTAEALGLLTDKELDWLPGEAGKASRQFVLGRAFFVCLPDASGDLKPTVVGGIAQCRSTPTRIHGANDAITVGLIRDGLGRCPGVTESDIGRFRDPGRLGASDIRRADYDSWDRLPR